MEGLSTNSHRITSDRYGNSKGFTKICRQKMSIMFNHIIMYVYIYISRTLVVGESYYSAKTQTEYSTAPPDWTDCHRCGGSLTAQQRRSQ